MELGCVRLELSFFPVQCRGQMVLQRLTHRTHPQRVGQLVAVDADGPAECRHLFGRPATPDVRCLELDFDHAAFDRQPSLSDLRYSGGVGQHELDSPRRRHPEVADLGVQRATVIGGLRPLCIAEERLADVTEGDFLEVVERLDRRIDASTPTCPDPQQGSENGNTGIEVGHGASLWIGHLGYSMPMVADTAVGLPEKIDACLFDLDGVLTDTASVHRKAWKAMFDEYLRARAERTGDRFVPFDTESDYQTYVDGKKREDGVRSFLDSRDITLPDGDPDDDPSAETVSGLGNRKNDLFLNTLHEEGIEVFEGSRRYLDAVAAAGLAVAVVSSSANTREVLEITGLARYVAARVDGVTMRDEGIAGKPAPDSFLRAAELLDVPPDRAAVFEDAVAGVEAGHAGHFGAVIGVDRVDHAEALRRNGADTVVSDLAELLGAS
jgi:beta-phosphoglucomutase family hydrolase